MKINIRSFFDAQYSYYFNRCDPSDPADRSSLKHARGAEIMLDELYHKDPGVKDKTVCDLLEEAKTIFCTQISQGQKDRNSFYFPNAHDHKYACRIVRIIFYYSLLQLSKEEGKNIKRRKT